MQTLVRSAAAHRILSTSSINAARASFPRSLQTTLIRNMSSTPFIGGPGPVIVPLSIVFRNSITNVLQASTGQSSAYDTAFDDAFASHVLATINGKSQSRTNLKDYIRQIGTGFQSETVEFSSLIEHRDDEDSEAAGEVGAFFSWTGARKFRVHDAAVEVKASVSTNATLKTFDDDLLTGRKITAITVVSEETPVDN